MSKWLPTEDFNFFVSLVVTVKFKIFLCGKKTAIALLFSVCRQSFISIFFLIQTGEPCTRKLCFSFAATWWEWKKPMNRIKTQITFFSNIFQHQIFFSLCRLFLCSLWFFGRKSSAWKLIFREILISVFLILQRQKL